MSRLIETLCILNGEVRNPEFHQKRLDRSRWKLFGLDDEINLEVLIKKGLQDISPTEKLKCRIVYGEKIESVELIPYQIKPIHSVRLVENNEIEYPFKFTDRSAFELMKD